MWVRHISRELDGKWSSWDPNCYKYVVLVLTGEDLATELSGQACSPLQCVCVVCLKTGSVHCINNFNSMHLISYLVLKTIKCHRTRCVSVHVRLALYILLPWSIPVCVTFLSLKWKLRCSCFWGHILLWTACSHKENSYLILISNVIVLETKAFRMWTDHESTNRIKAQTKRF